MTPVIIGSVLYGADEIVSDMVRQRIPNARETGFGECLALGVVRRGVLIGGVVFNNYRRFDVHMTAAFDGVGWALPQTLAALCDFPFNRLGVRRVTSITGKRNRKARNALEYIGFTLEGTGRLAYDGVDDACVYGLLKENCKWLKG